MTGLWQVSGKNKLSFEQMIRLDIEYSRHLSPLKDLRILLLTGPAIIRMIFEAGVERLRGRGMVSSSSERGVESGVASEERFVSGT
jgi:hypothetical protein